jgi:hypothetical protein
VKQSGEIIAQINGDALPPNTPVEITFTAPSVPASGALPRKRAIVGTDGKVQASVTLDSARAQTVGRPVKVIGRWQIVRNGALVAAVDSTSF